MACHRARTIKSKRAVLRFEFLSLLTFGRHGRTKPLGIRALKVPRIFLSHLPADQPLADQLATLLQASGFELCKSWDAMQPEAASEASLEDCVKGATHTVVLIGPQTRFSLWVDHEIERSTEPRDDGPGAALIGVILPNHEDYSRPYYDPENIPLRLHDLIQSEYAIVRKWTEDPAEIRRWLEDADGRRHRHCPEPSLGAAAQLYRFSWNAEVDAPRAPPKSP
jgi:hypothetical protein